MARISYYTLICFIVILHAGCIKSDDQIYNVAMPELPSRINPADSDINYAFYIIKQLHMPLFLYDLANQPKSTLLREWSSFNNHRKYKFCLKDNIKFSNNKNVTVKDLSENFEYFNKQKYFRKSIASIKQDGNCLIVTFSESYPQLTVDLMSYKMSIIDNSTRNERVVIGISPYHVENFSDKEVYLSTSKRLKFKDIYFKQWNPVDGDKLWQYDDINIIPSTYLTDDIENHMNRYDVDILKTYVVIINHTDESVRKYLFNCVDYKKIRQILYPNKEKFVDIGGILPLGLSGAVADPVEQKCPSQPINKKIALSLPTFYRNRIFDLQSYLDQVLLPLNIKINVSHITPNGLIEKMRSKNKQFHLTIVGLDALYPSSISFFDYFISNKSMWTKIRNNKLEKIIASEIHKGNNTISEKDAKAANHALIANYQVIPLFQEKRPFYFSNKVKYIKSDQLFMGMPYIGELQ